MAKKSKIVTALRLMRFAGSIAMLFVVVAGVCGYGDQVKLVAAAGGGAVGVFLKASHLVA